MSIRTEIEVFLQSLTEKTREEIMEIEQLILEAAPNCRLWFLDGKNANGKTVTNANIGYGLQKLHYKDGSFRDFYQVGISPNKSGISMYFIGLEDRNYLKK